LAYLETGLGLSYQYADNVSVLLSFGWFFIETQTQPHRAGDRPSHLRFQTGA
jgi:hypothetical protein